MSAEPSCLETDHPQNEFYEKAVNYWSEIPATVNGMLGGFGQISSVDIHSSKQFLKFLFQSKRPPGKQRALDCGAGIGRITKHLLAHLFEMVDLVEQNPFFLEQAKEYIGPRLIQKIGSLYPAGLQNFEPENKYDVIWCQWVLAHLTDVDLVNFLNRCRGGLKDNGVIIIKENVTSTGEVNKDEMDSSATRPFSLFMELFKKANFDCFKKSKQLNFPRGLFTVYTFALRPQLNAKALDDSKINID